MEVKRTNRKYLDQGGWEGANRIKALRQERTKSKRCMGQGGAAKADPSGAASQAYLAARAKRSDLSRTQYDLHFS